VIRLSLWGIEIYHRRKLLSCEKHLRILTSLLYTAQSRKAETRMVFWVRFYSCAYWKIFFFFFKYKRQNFSALISFPLNTVIHQSIFLERKFPLSDESSVAAAHFLPCVSNTERANAKNCGIMHFCYFVTVFFFSSAYRRVAFTSHRVCVCVR
jgi:hypothetical protein